MHKRMKMLLSVLSAMALLVSALAVAPASASEFEAPLTVKATSNYFPESKNKYYLLSEFEDENGDAFVTVEYKLLADQKYLVNVDIGELTYNPDVLEWSSDYNQYGEGRSSRLDFFPFAAENNLGVGIVHKTAEGRLVGNFSSVKPPAWAYNEDGTAVTVVKAVFKVLDRAAGETAVNCNVEYLAMCDESEPTPYVQYQVVNKYEVNTALDLGETISTVISPDSQDASVIAGDVDKDGSVTINDATLLQEYLAEFTDNQGKPVLDLSSNEMLVRADANRDGKINIRDITQIQRLVSQLINTL